MWWPFDCLSCTTPSVARHVTLPLQQKQNECKQKQQYRHLTEQKPECSVRGINKKSQTKEEMRTCKASSFFCFAIVCKRCTIADNKELYGIIGVYGYRKHSLWWQVSNWTRLLPKPVCFSARSDGHNFRVRRFGFDEVHKVRVLLWGTGSGSK